MWKTIQQTPSTTPNQTFHNSFNAMNCDVCWFVDWLIGAAAQLFSFNPLNQFNKPINKTKLFWFVLNWWLIGVDERLSCCCGAPVNWWNQLSFSWPGGLSQTNISSNQLFNRASAGEEKFNLIPFTYRGGATALGHRWQREVAAELLSLISLNSIKSFNSCLLSAALPFFFFCFIHLINWGCLLAFALLGGAIGWPTSP